MIGEYSLLPFIVAVVVVGASVSARQINTGINTQVQSMEILDQISSGHARSLLQMADNERVVISVPAETEVTLDLLFKNGTSEQRQYRGPFTYFFQLEEVEQISIIPSEDMDVEVGQQSNSNTIILSSHTDKNSTNESPPFQTYSTDAPVQMLPGLIVETEQSYVPIVNETEGSNLIFETVLYSANEPSGSYVVGQGQQSPDLTGAFSTIVSVNVDDRNTSSNTDFGIPFQPLTPPQSLINYLTPSTPTLQRGLPNPYTPTSSLSNPPPIQDNSFQQSIYDQFQDLQISLSVSVPPLTENIDQYQGETDIFDAMIMSVAGSQNGNLVDSVLVDSGDVQPTQRQGGNQGVIIERDPSQCIQMEELIQENGGELFLQAMKVANLDFDTIGDIIVVFLPDSRALERQLLSAELDLLSPQLSPSQLNSLRQLLLYHIVPDVLLLNLASVATPRSLPLVSANQQSFSLGIQQDEIIILQNNNNNNNNNNNSSGEIRVGSSIPSVACQGFLFMLDSVLIPANSI